MPQPDDRYFESARLRLHYAVWGDESNPPLVLVHGGRDHARMWDYVIERLVDRYACYALDQRGHGDSDWALGGTYTLSSYVSDLARLLDVIGRRPVTLIGHSMGGRVVLDYSATFPDDVVKVVAIEGFGRIGSVREPFEQMQGYTKMRAEMEGRQQRPYDTIEEAEKRMHEANQRLTPEMVRHLTEHAVRRREDGKYVWKFDNYVRLTNAPEWDPDDTRRLWSHITAPVLHVGGEESWGHRFMNRVELADATPTGRTVIFPDAAHWVHHDQLDGFVTLVRDFLGQS